MNTIDKILFGLVGFIIGFTISMIVLFCIFQAIPDVLVECVFTAGCSEAIITFAIWWIKKKYGKNVSKTCQDKEKNKCEPVKPINDA